jgi:hypothetical protein
MDIFRALVFVVCGLSSMGVYLPAHARSFEGFEFEEQSQLVQTPLQLNGVGVRQVAWLKGYAAGLYVQKMTREAQVILDAGSPVRIKMGLMLGVGTQEFTKAIKSGIRKNYSDTDQAKLADRIDRFDALMKDIGTVKKGDVIWLDGIPDKGLVVQVNGQARGQPIPGDDFVKAVLSIFIGQRPVDEKLKAGLLKAAASGASSSASSALLQLQ